MGVRSQSSSKDQKPGLYWGSVSVRVFWVARDIKPKRQIVGSHGLVLASCMARSRCEVMATRPSVLLHFLALPPLPCHPQADFPPPGGRMTAAASDHTLPGVGPAAKQVCRLLVASTQGVGFTHRTNFDRAPTSADHCGHGRGPAGNTDPRGASWERNWGSFQKKGKQIKLVNVHRSQTDRIVPAPRLYFLSHSREKLTCRAVGILTPREFACLRVKVRGQPGHQVERGQKSNDRSVHGREVRASGRRL